MAVSRNGTYASAGKAVVVERAATDAAFRLAKSGRDAVYNGRRDAVWRARTDGVVEVARGEWGRVELYEVYNDGIAHLVAQSRRSVTKVAASLCGFAAVASLFVSVLGAIFVSEGFIALVALSFVLSLLTFVLRWTSDVRPWLRAQFGSDGDWSQVPWEIEGTPTTGNQTLALTAIADDRKVRYRVLDDGTLEVVIRAGKQVEVLAIDRYGAATVTETLPSKRFKLDRLRGADINWHQVITIDPTD